MHKTVLELKVNNHPGVMSHVSGLFARRSFNIEGILCGPVEDGRRSAMYLLVNETGRLDQVVKQLEKLYDVIEVKECRNCEPGIFSRLGELVGT